MSATALYKQYDKAVSNAVFSLLRHFGYDMRKSGNKVTLALPLVASPTGLVTALIAYFLMIAVGMAYYRRRASSTTSSVKSTAAKASTSTPPPSSDPTWLRALMAVHNLILIVLSAYMGTSAAYQAYKLKYKFWGQRYNARETDIAFVVWVFFVSKIYEFLDTAIMLLKGNLQQVTFLHVYHHFSIASIWWVIAYSAPGGDAWYSVMLNSYVHVVMYTYYLLSMFKTRFSSGFQKYLSAFGKNVTRFQMSQFVSMIVQGGYCYFKSDYPKFLSRMYFYYIISLLALFLNFYLRKHGAKKKTA